MRLVSLSTIRKGRNTMDEFNWGPAFDPDATEDDYDPFAAASEKMEASWTYMREEEKNKEDQEIREIERAAFESNSKCGKNGHRFNEGYNSIELYKLYKAGKSFREIEKITGCPRSTASRRVKKMKDVAAKALMGHSGGDTKNDGQC